MIQTEFSSAVNQICAERGIDPAVVYETIKIALLAAFRKDYGGDVEELTVQLDEDSGEARILDEGSRDVTPPGFGRIAAQTAKQVILQKIREAEREAVCEEYRDKLGTIASGHIFRIDKGTVVVDLGRAQVVMPPSEQIPGERYSQGQRIKVLIKELYNDEENGGKIIVSRSAPKFVKELFSLEVPEIRSGSVTIEATAREAGERTKVAVLSSDDNVDPVGSCVGRKGVRVQAVIEELANEKIDIVAYSEDIEEFISSALAPAEVEKVILNKKKHQARVYVPEDQLSLAIGKEGQNVRLAAKLTGWKIDIAGSSVAAVSSSPAEDSEVGGLAGLGLPTRVTNALSAAGFASADRLRETDPEELSEIKGIGKKALEGISEALKN